MSWLNTVPARLSTVAMGVLAALVLTEYLAFRMLGLFLAPDARGGYTITAGGGEAHWLALANLMSLVVLIVLLVALVAVVYRGRPVDRPLAIAGGYVGACLAAGLALLVAYAALGAAPAAPAGGSGWLTALGSLYLGVKLAGFVIGLLALAPAAVIIIFAERRGLRSPVFYGAAGALSAVTAATIVFGLQFAAGAPLSALSQGRVPLAGLFALFAVPGLAGGLAYWLIAGRNTQVAR